MGIRKLKIDHLIFGVFYILFTKEATQESPSKQFGASVTISSFVNTASASKQVLALIQKEGKFWEEFSLWHILSSIQNEYLKNEIFQAQVNFD